MPVEYWRLVTPSSETMTNSPGSTSRIIGAEQIEGAGFAGKDDGVGAVGVLHAAHGERAEAARIAGGEDAVARHHDDGESALDLRERVGDGSRPAWRHGSGR